MTQIINSKGLIWMGSTSDCTSVGLADFLGQISDVFTTTQSGIDSSDPLRASLLAGFQYIECGAAYLVYSNPAGIPYNMDFAVTGNLDVDSGRVGLSSVNLVERFTMTGIPTNQDANGTYVMSTSFSNNKPLYRNENGWYAVYNDDSTWSLNDSLAHPTLEYKNDNINPSGGIYIQVNIGPTGPVPTPTPSPSPTPPPQPLGAEILARWDAQYASTNVYVEEPISGYNFLAPPATIKPDLSEESRGRVFTFSNEAHFCKLGDILSETFHSASFSISFWCNPNHVYALGQPSACYQGGGDVTCRSGIMLGKWYSSPVIYDNAWLIYSNGSIVTDGSLNSTPQSTYITESIPTNTGTWTHLVYSFQPVNANKEARATVYMNGVDVTHPNSANVIHSFDLEASTPFVLGNISRDGYPGKYGFWGSLDDVRIYDGSLSAQDALAIYNATDPESQRQPFNIPVVEAIETSVPMGDGIEKVEGYDIMLDQQVYGISVIGDKLAVIVPHSSDGETIPVVRFYARRDWPPTDQLDDSGRYLRTELMYVDISDAVSTASDVKYFKWIRTETPARNILILWTYDSGLRIFKESPDGGWVSSGISVNMTTDESKVEYVEYDDVADDVVMIFNQGNVTSYKRDSYGFWYTIGNETDVSAFSVSGKQLLLSYHRYTQDAFDLSAFDISKVSEIPGVGPGVNEVGYYTHHGSYNSNDLALVTTGSDVYVTFTGTQNESFKFDPSDGYLSHASPNTIYQLSENLNLLQTTFPPYRLSGIDYKHIHNFGTDIHVGNKYMVVTANLCEFAWLYEKSSSGDWEFVSRLVYGVTSPTPRCFVGDDYCLIHCGESDTLDRLVYFELGESLTSTDETLPVVDDDLVAWWDLGPRYGHLGDYSHVAFDKSGHNTHLGVSDTYTSLASSDIPGAIDSSEIYKFDNLNSPCVCKSPISDDVFKGAFTISVWFYRTNESNRAIISKADSLGGPTFDINRTFVMYANGNMYVGETGNHQLITPIKSNEWTFLTLVRNGPITKSYINGQLSSETTGVVVGHTDEDLQVAPQGDIGYVDDIKVYKKALAAHEIGLEFEKSYRHEFLTR